MDTNDFEMFLQLDDVNDTGFSKETKQAIQSDLQRVQADREQAESYVSQFDEESEADDVPQEEITDWSFLEEDGNPLFEDEQKEETIEENDAEDESEEVTSGDYDDTEDESEGDYDYSVDEDTTLNLPDGRVMSIGELQKKALYGEELEQRESQLNERITNFNQQYEAAKDTIEIAELEADRIIASYTDEYLEDLYNNDRAAYADEVRYLERMKARKTSLLAEQAKIKAKQEEIKAQEFQKQSDACVEVLNKVIPGGWNNNIYEQLLNYAVTEYDEDPEEVLKWNKPSEFIRLYKLYKYEKGINKATASLKGAKKGGKFISSNGKAANTSATKNAKAEKMGHLFSQGKASTSDVFAFLED